MELPTDTAAITNQAASIPAPAIAPRRGWLLLKLSIGAALIYYVLHTDRFHFDQLKNIPPGIFALALASFSVQMFIGTQRLRMLLAPQGIRLNYITVLRLNYLGAFFDVFMLTAVGGDAVKALYLARMTPSGRRTAAVSVLVLDRLMGLLGLLLLTLLVSLWQMDVLWSDALIRPYMLALAGVSGCLLAGTGLLLSKTFYTSWIVQTILRKIPLGKIIDTAYASLQNFRNYPWVLFGTLLLSLFAHVFGVLTGYVLMTGLIAPPRPELGPFFVAWLISNFVSSFLPLGGIGGGQLAFGVVFKTIAGISIGDTLATAIQVTCLVAKSPGLPAWLLSREHTPVTESAG